MNCAYHSQSVAVVNCNGCGKPLCPACDHRIKGFPFCQDCIVAGVELLRHHNQSHHQSSYVPLIKAQTSPLIATLLSFVCPGLGAAYNGQTGKALIHFAVAVGLFQMAILTGMAVFAFGVLGMWLYAAVDAWKTAKLIRSGVTPDGAEDFIVKRFAGNTKLWGIVLTVLGALFFLQAFFNLRGLMRGILPVLLIGLGIYLLRDYVFKPKETAGNWSGPDGQTNAPVFVSALSDPAFRSEDYDVQTDYSTKGQIRNWKSR